MILAVALHGDSNQHEMIEIKRHETKDPTILNAIALSLAQINDESLLSKLYWIT